VLAGKSGSYRSRVVKLSKPGRVAGRRDFSNDKGRKDLQAEVKLSGGGQPAKKAHVKETEKPAGGREALMGLVL